MPRTLRIETPHVFRPLLYPSRYKGAFGGRGGGKSHAFADLLIERCLLQPRTRAVCVREVQRSLEQSVKRLVEDKIQQYELGTEFRVLNTHIETPGGGIIKFEGLQNHTAESIKSLEGYDVAWVEEAQTLSQRSLDILTPTIRVEGSEIWFSWNPRKPTDPVDAFLRSDPPPNAVVVEVTYRDNPWFPGVLRDEMLWARAHDPDKYAHIWLGDYERHSEARVFRNYTVQEFDTPEGVTFYLGGDWGFAVDPTVLMRCFIQGRNLFIDWEVYRVGCEIDQTPALFDQLGCPTCLRGPAATACKDESHGMARRWIITADSARPETISYLQRHGYPRIRPATKGAGSVKEGVEFLKSYEVVIHPRCVHTIDEFAAYSYKQDRLTGEIIPELQDKKNHVIDSARYAIEQVRRQPARTVRVQLG